MIQAGGAMSDITPEPSTHLAGAGASEHRPSGNVLDPLFAKAVIFQADGRTICLVSLDVPIVTEE